MGGYKGPLRGVASRRRSPGDVLDWIDQAQSANRDWAGSRLIAFLVLVAIAALAYAAGLLPS